MIITIRVISIQGLTPHLPMSAQFDENGGTIGRDNQNTLTLSDPDRIVSRIHAEVSFADQFFYNDKSANGTFITKENRTIFDGESIPLNNCDRLTVGKYDLEVILEDDHRPVIFDDFPLPPASDNLSDLFFPDSQVNHFAQEPFSEQKQKNDSLPSSWLKWDQNSIQNLADTENITPNLIDSNLYETSDKEILGITEPHSPEPNEQHPDHPSIPNRHIGTDSFRLFLEGAGLDFPADITVEEQADAIIAVGLIFRLVIDGLMNMLRIRAEEKTEIRASVTLINTKNNNPLKFLPSSEAAINAMLYKKYQKMGFIDPVSAIQEALSDINAHELAFRSATKASLKEILDQFNPDIIQTTVRDSSIFKLKKAANWDAYCTIYPNLIEKAMENLFKGKFVEAYENHVNAIKESFQNE